MSPSGSDVMQEKEADTPVVWNDLDGLRTHLEGVLERSTLEGVNAHQALQLQVQGTATNVAMMQAQFTTFQQSIDQLTQSLAALRQPIAPPLVQPADDFVDDDSVHDNANLLGPNDVGVVLDNRVGYHQSLVPDAYSLLRTIIWGSQSSRYPILMAKVMWKITLLGSSGSRHSGVCMVTLKIKRSDLRPPNLMAIHCVGGIIF
jgi:hypothetical protein